jgi:hypothetical protein
VRYRMRRSPARGHAERLGTDRVFPGQASAASGNRPVLASADSASESAVFAVSARRVQRFCLPAFSNRNGGQRARHCRWSRYAKNGPKLWRNVLTTLETATETATEPAPEFGKQTRESIEELGRSAGRKLDEARDETGAALHSAASSVRRTGRDSSAAINNCSTHTADRLDAAGSYIEDHDLTDAVTGLRRVAHRHLTGSIIAAVAVGVLAGAFLSRVTHTCERVFESTQP